MTTSLSNSYVAGHATALDLLARLQEAIQDMPEPEADGVNWGHVGSLSHINGQLRDLLAFANGTAP